MKFKKFKKSHRLIKNELETFSQLRCKILVSTNKDTQWSSPIDCLVDTGCDITTFPKQLLDDLQINYEITGELPIVMADGTESIGQLISLRIRILTNDSINKDVLVDVPCILNEGATEPLLGLSVLQHYDYIVIGGELKILRQNESFQELDDVPFKVSTIKIAPSNIVPPDNFPKTLTYPKPLSPPGSVSPRKGAFLPQLKPTGAKMPK